MMRIPSVLIAKIPKILHFNNIQYGEACVIQSFILNVHNRKCTGSAYIKDKSKYTSAPPLITDANMHYKAPLLCLSVLI